MGLSVLVGVFSDLGEDEEGIESFAQNFEAVNRELRKRGLPVHNEPRDPGGSWSGDMFGYSSLHTVRRLAAHLEAGRPLPPPSPNDRSKDPVLEARYEKSGKTDSGLMGRLTGLFKSPPPSFSHLIDHSDAEGFYLPIDFEKVIVANDSEIPGGFIGSTPRLQNELRILARAIELPEDYDPEGEEAQEATETSSPSGPKWRRYGTESHGIGVLLEACAQSMRLRSAIVFT